MSDVTPGPMGGIGLCPSPPHRGVLGLARAALGCPVDESLQTDLRNSDPGDLVRIAVHNYVHVVMATAFEREPGLAGAVPEDLVIFFGEMQAANLRRNESIRTQLAAIGAALSSAGVRGTVLKGGAELLAPVFPEPAFRFLSDIDILVPEKDLDRAVESLHGIDAQSDPGDETNYLDHHHLAPLRREDWPVLLELHRALGSAADGGAQLSNAMLGAAYPSGLPGLDLPAPPHRLAHAVFHAQIQSLRYRMRELSLRDALEFEILSRSLPPGDIAAAAALMSGTDGRQAWEALDASRRLVFGTEAEIEALPDAARSWAEKAITLFGRPGHRTFATSVWLLRRYVEEFFLDPPRRRYFLRQLSRRGGLRKALASRRDDFRRMR